MEAKAVIKRLCELQAKVSEVIGYHYAADCFCGQDGFGAKHVHSPQYRNDGKSLEFIERVTREALARMKEPQHSETRSAPLLKQKRLRRRTGKCAAFSPDIHRLRRQRRNGSRGRPLRPDGSSFSGPMTRSESGTTR